MTRRVFIVLLVLFGCFAMWHAVAPEASAAGTLSVAEIRTALRVSAEQDNGFIASMIQKVETGKLPRSTFDKAFLYAKKQPSHKFEHFKRGIRVLAARQGIKL